MVGDRRVQGATRKLLTLYIIVSTLLEEVWSSSRAEAGKVSEPSLWRDWRATHKEGLKVGRDEDVLRALSDWSELMSQPKLAAAIPDHFKTMPTTSVVGGACTDDHEATLGVFGFSCTERECVFLFTKVKM